MIFEIDQKILETFEGSDIKVYFYASGCEGTKVHLTSDFEKTNLESFSLWGKNIYYEKNDSENLNWAKILKKLDNSWTWHKNNDKYLFISPKVQSRCGCATSFSFEKKLIDKSKLKTLQGIFKK